MSSKLAAGNSTIVHLVERQMRNWELARLQRHTAAEPQRHEVEDFLCVSRQVGTEGKEVAVRLGERLGWPVFDRQVLEAMAGDNERRRQIYASMDERDLGWWEETLRSLMEGEFVRNDYFRRLCETLLSLARQGHSIFLGRGADLVLPRDRGFRVRLMAPRARRLGHFARAHGLSREEALREMDRIESERKRFFQRHFGVDVDDPWRYDMTINLDRFSAGQAAELILHARRVFQRAR
jgi:hypothetical protein